LRDPHSAAFVEADMRRLRHLGLVQHEIHREIICVVIFP
jgi:hypothetical protein